MLGGCHRGLRLQHVPLDGWTSSSESEDGFISDSRTTWVLLLHRQLHFSDADSDAPHSFENDTLGETATGKLPKASFLQKPKF